MNVKLRQTKESIDSQCIRNILGIFVILLVTPQVPSTAQSIGSRIVSVPPSSPASSLSSAADVIVKGRLLSVQITPGQPTKARVEVQRVLKGDVSSKEIVLTFSPSGEKGPLYYSWDDFTLKVPGETALFFLKKDNGDLATVSFHAPLLPVRDACTDGTGVTAQADVVAQVRSELLCTASGPLTLSKSEQAKPPMIEKGRAASRHKYAFTPYKPQSMNVVAVRELASFPADEEAIAALKRLLPSPDRRLRGAVLATLLRWKQWDILKPAIEYIDATPADEDAPAEAPPPFAVNPRNADLQSENSRKIIGALGSSKSVEAIDVLDQVFSSKSVHLRLAAVEALRNIYNFNMGNPLKKLTDARSVPLLAKALDDEDFEVRFQAIAELAEITQNLRWYPTYELPPYTGTSTAPPEEQKFLAYWKQWWQTQGKPAFDAEK